MATEDEILKKAQSLIVRARVQLLLSQPFFGVLATYLEPKPAQLAPYSGGMGTDGKHLYYQPEKIVELPEEQLIGVIAHEILHLALAHLWRREHREPLRWNIATDLAVNSIVLQNFELPKWVLYDKRFEGKCAEEVYNLLPCPQCPKCGSKNIRGLKFKSTKRADGSFDVEAEFGCEKCGHTWKEHQTWEPYDKWRQRGSLPGFPVSFEQVEGELPTTLDDHGVWGKTEPNGLDPKTRAERQEQEWKQRVVRAARVAKSQGKLPVGLKRFIEDLLYPKLSWRHLLWQYTNRIRGMRPNWRRPNKKWIQYGVYYPTKRDRRLEAAVAIDTSGSISDEELREFLSELRGILSTFRSFRVRMLACDAAVHTDVTATSLDDFDSFRVKVKGGGGTDFRPVFEALEGDRTQVLVYLTDGYGTYPESPPPYDVIWVISSEGDEKRPPFGRVLKMSPSKPAGR
jgi:predicted metal-dependent peptidase